MVRIRTRNARQTIRQPIFGLILSDQTIQASFLATGRLVLPRRACSAVGIVGINFERQLAGRAILTKSGTFVAECAVLTWNAVAQRIVIIDIIRIVRDEPVGGTCFALEVVQCCFVLVTTTTTNDAGFCVGNVFVTKFVAHFAIAWGNMLRGVRCLVEKELARGASFAGGGRGVTAVLKLAGVANGTERLVNVLTSKRAKVAGNVFGVESAVVDDKLSSLAKIAGNVEIQMGLVLIVTGWANLTVEILVIDENSPGRAGLAVGVAGARVGGTDGAGRAIELSC